MSSHFSAIGMPVDSDGEFHGLVERAFVDVPPVPVDGGAYYYWSDPSGAELWLQTDEQNEIVGVNPHFRGEASLKVGITAPVERDLSALDGAFHGWADPTDEPDSGMYPLVFDVPDFLLNTPGPLPKICDVQVAAFAHEIEVHDDPEAYAAGQESEVKFASESFVPSGLFSPDGESSDPPGAFGILSGVVLDVSERVNGLTGDKFVHCRVRSLGGEYDVVADPGQVPEAPPVGGVVSGSFWLSGSVRSQA